MSRAGRPRGPMVSAEGAGGRAGRRGAMPGPWTALCKAATPRGLVLRPQDPQDTEHWSSQREDGQDSCAEAPTPAGGQVGTCGVTGRLFWGATSRVGRTCRPRPAAPRLGLPGTVPAGVPLPPARAGWVPAASDRWRHSAADGHCERDTAAATPQWLPHCLGPLGEELWPPRVDSWCGHRAVAGCPDAANVSALRGPHPRFRRPCVLGGSRAASGGAWGWCSVLSTQLGFGPRQARC